jgi:hypothetical protein
VAELRAALTEADIAIGGLDLEQLLATGLDATNLRELLATLRADRKVRHPPSLAAKLLGGDPDHWRRRIGLDAAPTSTLPAHYDGTADALTRRYLIAEGERWPSWSAWADAILSAWRTGTYTVRDLAWFSRLGEEPADLARVRRTLEEAGEDPAQQPGSRRAAPSAPRPPFLRQAAQAAAGGPHDG